MFRDVSLGPVRFKSKSTKQLSTASTLTDPIETRECDVQTDGGAVDASTQTESKAATAPSKSSSKDANNAESEQERARALEMLANVGPLMLREVAATGKMSGFFAGLDKFLAESEEKDISKLMTLRFDYDSYFQQQQQQQQVDVKGKKVMAASSTLALSCTGVSWNATGAMVAVAYGRFDHSGWCNYRSALCLWRVFQPDFNPDKPHLVLEASSGLMCVACHPKNPAIIAAGSFNGEVFVWDTEPEEYKFLSSGIGDYFHREPVTKVAWVFDSQANEYNVASVSGDGKILFWRLKDKLAFPVEGYVMHVPTASSVSAGDDKAVRMQAIGGKALAFCSNDKTSRSFVVGSDGGLLARCFAKGQARSADFKGDKKWTATAARLVGKLPTARIPAVRRQVESHASDKRSKEITLAMVYESKVDPAALYPSAMDFVFDSHNGPVYDVRFSPFRKSLFLSCSSDGTARVYSYLHKQALLALEVAPSASYLYAAEWSRTRPAVFAIACEDGNVYVFDLKADRLGPVAVLSGRDAPSGAGTNANGTNAAGSPSSTASKAGKPGGAAPMFTLDFNPRQRNFLAAGDARGVVHVWKLSWQLANFQTGEADLLETLELDA